MNLKLKFGKTKFFIKKEDWDFYKEWEREQSIKAIAHGNEMIKKLHNGTLK